jgi:uncharacterized protein with GYD domain
MATFVSLANFTDQGIRNVKETTSRADAIREKARKFGVEIKQMLWTLGSYDIVVVFDAPDDAAATTLGLAIGISGNVRTQTLRAFSKDEIQGMLGKLT